MMKYTLAVSIALGLFVANVAQAAAHRARDDAAARYRAQSSTFSPIEPGAAGGLVHSAIDCAPGQAEPSWGGRNALLGYICINSGN